MFSAACGGQHSEKDILQEIDFIMTDSTADDLNVTKNVCQELGWDSVPNSLECDLHALMMFVKRKGGWVNRTKECFLIGISYKN